MSEPEPVRFDVPKTPATQAAYYTERLVVDVSEELYRLLEEQGMSIYDLRKLVLCDAVVDEHTRLDDVALMFLALGYHLEVTAVKNKETDHESCSDHGFIAPRSFPRRGHRT